MKVIYLKTNPVVWACVCVTAIAIPSHSLVHFLLPADPGLEGGGVLDTVGIVFFGGGDTDTLPPTPIPPPPAPASLAFLTALAVGNADLADGGWAEALAGGNAPFVLLFGCADDGGGCFLLSSRGVSSSPSSSSGLSFSMIPSFSPTHLWIRKYKNFDCKHWYVLDSFHLIQIFSFNFKELWKLC